MLASDEEGGTLDALRFSLASEIVELVVLTGDELFLQTLREAVGSARRLWHVLSADKVSDLLVAGQVGILVLDVQALNEASAVFVAQIKRQFPDLVVVVAGNRDAENSLAALISAGTVYRFIHKPMSPGRAKSFADAAVKKYDEQRRRPAAIPPVKSQPRSSRGALIGGTVSVLAVIGVAVWVMHRSGDVGAPRAGGAAGPSAESSQLSDAAAALAANRLTQPADDNALALYRQALVRNPADPIARAGVAEVRERLLARAENALLEERLDEAEAAIETARQSGVEGGRIAFLTAQLAKSRERAKSVQAAARARNARKPAEDKAALQPTLAAESIDDTHTNDAVKDTVPDLPAAARPEADADTPVIEPADDSARYASPESASAQHDLEAAAARQQFLANVVPAGALTLVKSVRPIYPIRANWNKIQGWVELDFTVAESGAVKDIAVHAASAPGVFEDAAISALSQWRYQPMQRDAKSVAQRARIRIRFTLAD
ncbi:MAG TPA: TonB family protein [Steroidobacteraceae bacterium]